MIRPIFLKPLQLKALFSELKNNLTQDPMKSARAKLNEDFLQNAKIKNAVFWLLYTHPIAPWAHAEMQIGHKRISVANEIKTVHDVNPKTRKYDIGRPYLAIGLIVSPIALRKIEEALEAHSLQGVNCADVSARYIERGIPNFIPYPIRFSPIFSTIYLLIKSTFQSKNKKIDTVEIRSKNRSFMDLLSIAPIGETLATLGILWLARAILNPPKT